MSGVAPVSNPIEEYALLGGWETAALLNRDGAIEWLYWPGFYDAACLAALLGTAVNGHWTLAPADAVTQRSARSCATPNSTSPISPHSREPLPIFSAP